MEAYLSQHMKIALQMDPLEGISIAGDSTFLLGLGAQERGHTLYYYQPKQLVWREGRVQALAQKVTLRAVKGDHFSADAPRWIDLNDMDVVLLRQDPPFDMGYITNTHLLEHLKQTTRVINDPAGVRNAPEKLLMLYAAPFMPPTLIASDETSLQYFAGRYESVVAKRLYGNAGRDVFRFKQGDPALYEFARAQYAAAREPILVQPFLPEVETGDKRIILFGGKVAGAFRRIPAKGEFRANLALGGMAEPCDLSPRDLEICAALAPRLVDMGLYFVGLDVIGDHLIEINVTSPTGLASINTLYNLQGEKRMEQLFWRGLE
jgi:glutathione synthase